MRARFEICTAAMFIGVGLAGLPLEPWRIAAAAVLCAAIAAASGRFIAGTALLATFAAGWLQHQQLRVSFFAAAAVIGIFARAAQARPAFAAALAIAGIAAGTALLVFVR